MAYQECRREEVYMTEQQRKAPGRPAAERFYAEHVGLPAAGGSMEAALQEAINEKTKRSWKLVSIAEEPSGDGLLLVWDTSGFFSG
jgi:hypothetical protein